MKISIKTYLYLSLLPIFILKFNIVNCQILTNSNLPIIIINTGGANIPDEPKIPASFQIINNGSGLINNINDFPNHYNGFCGIETRGNSTQGFQKNLFH